MISRFLNWMFGRDSNAGQPLSGERVSKHGVAPSNVGEVKMAVRRGKAIREKSSDEKHKVSVRTKKAKQSEDPLPRRTTKDDRGTGGPMPDPLDLDIGLDIGTSCSKAVIGNRELNEQVAVPINGGRTLAGFLLPTRVYIADGEYSLDETDGAVVRRNLKIRLIHGGNGTAAGDTICDLAAFTALTLRRILEWHSEKASAKHGRRLVSWNLNVGLPSKGSVNDPFEAVYRRIVGAAVTSVPGDQPITLQSISAALAEASESEWLPDERIHYYPEAAAQLASLIFSPHRPEGCLLVVDVGAGTLDVSTIRIGGSNSGTRCAFHCCEVAPLGVHFLHLARGGQIPDRRDLSAFARLIESIPADDGTKAMPSVRASSVPSRFQERCKEVILKNVVKYRNHLKAAHISRTYRPWHAGLPYVLSGGGRRDEYFQTLLSTDLGQWLETVCSEWDPLITGPRRGLMLQPFPPPKAFTPRILVADFDRFSVAHGLSLGVDNLMQVTQAKIN